MTDHAAAAANDVARERATIFVCVTCLAGAAVGVEPTPGAKLAAATLEAAHGTGIDVQPVRCLANCTRGPSAAIRCRHSWTYVFGGLDAACADALVEGARLLHAAKDGLLPWRGRPEPLKRGLIARVPPLQLAEQSLGDR